MDATRVRPTEDVARLPVAPPQRLQEEEEDTDKSTVSQWLLIIEAAFLFFGIPATVLICSINHDVPLKWTFVALAYCILAYATTIVGTGAKNYKLLDICYPFVLFFKFFGALLLFAVVVWIVGNYVREGSLDHVHIPEFVPIVVFASVHFHLCHLCHEQLRRFDREASLRRQRFILGAPRGNNNASLYYFS